VYPKETKDANTSKQLMEKKVAKCLIIKKKIKKKNPSIPDKDIRIVRVNWIV
jgi:hypothetical protein